MSDSAPEPLNRVCPNCGQHVGRHSCCGDAEGRQLAALLQEHGPLKLERALDVFMQICEALSSAHANDTIHPYLAPSDIIVRPPSDTRDHHEVSIVDNASAKGSTDKTCESRNVNMTAETSAEPAYMSPEQCHGERLDARSDIYSLGCIMYEALTGMPPLLGPNDEATIAKQVSEAPLSLQSVEPSIPQDLDAIVLKCLEKNPVDRYQSANDLRHQLDQCARAWFSGRAAVNLVGSASIVAARNDKSAKDDVLTQDSHNRLRTLVLPLGIALLICFLIGCAFAYNVVMIANNHAITAEHSDADAPAADAIQATPMIEKMPVTEQTPKQQTKVR